LGEEFSEYLTEVRVRAAAARLGPLGEPGAVQVVTTEERGGMEVSILRLTFTRQTLSAVLYRSTDGKVQEFLIAR
jgi:hypothetical protein